MRTRGVAGVMAIVVVGGLAGSAAAAQGFTRVPEGFKASLVDALGSSCGGTGPSAIATDGSTHYFAINGSLYAKRPGSALRSYSGRVEPWGLALAGGSLFATQPGCNTSEAGQTPGPLTTCDLVRVSTENGESLGTIADVCGTGVAVLGSRLAVATRDGRIVTVSASGGAVSTVASNLRPVAVQLAWAPNGTTIFFTRLNGDGVWSVPAGGGAVKRVAAVGGVRGVLAGTKALGASGKLLAAGDGRLHLVRIDDGTRAEVGAAASLAGPLAAVGKTILVPMTEEAWVLTGAFPGPRSAPRRPVVSAPPGAPRPVPALPVGPPAAPAPPPVTPGQPPPPAPPAPPAPVQAFIIQPSAVTNPALVPAEQDPEVALRHAATRVQPIASTVEVWLVTVGAAALIGVAGFSAGGGRPRPAMAWAMAGNRTTTRDRHSMLR